MSELHGSNYFNIHRTIENWPHAIYCAGVGYWASLVCWAALVCGVNLRWPEVDWVWEPTVWVGHCDVPWLLAKVRDVLLPHSKHLGCDDSIFDCVHISSIGGIVEWSSWLFGVLLWSEYASVLLGWRFSHFGLCCIVTPPLTACQF